MPEFNRAIIIFNPNSTGNAQSGAKELQSALATAMPDLPVDLAPTERAGHAMELAYEAAKKDRSPLIISASGDGGYNEVINGALQAQAEGASPICAVLPSGNANDHARTMQDKPLAELILEGAITNLDVLKITIDDDRDTTTRYAHSYIGLGLTPAVAVELNKHTLNSLNEAWIVIRTFWNLRPVVIRTADKTERLDSLICSIIPEMAKVLTLSRDAQPDDGMFEIATLPHNQKLRLIGRLLKGVVGEMGARSRSKKLACTVVRAAPIQLDGEVMKLKANSELEITICPGLLRTIAAPTPSADTSA